eukprot:TRINITY_DN31070_c0_g1_i1.p1 TRINITY_DN31070_c0_g1~~TRINITY_DN31070_c0_g1_i1.p1  ORF type:complete len:191 (-),score=20.63 TRINITY_DN31070_c0_g1_i1:63-581(-)
MDDLEDYFHRLDSRRAEAGRTFSSEEAPSVERFDDEDFAALRRTEGLAGAECAICLASGLSGEVLELPCAAAHRFHEECARSWLLRNVTCPLCRVDVRALIRASSSPSSTRLPSPRAHGITRDGGVIARYDPHPPVEVARPSYIRPELHHLAELVEIEYPNQGTARVWRVPR